MVWGAGLSVLLHGLVTALFFFAPVRASLTDVLFSAEVELAVMPDEAVPDPLDDVVPEDDEPLPAEVERVRERLRPRPLPAALVPPAAVATVAILPDTLINPPTVEPLHPERELTPEERARERERLAIVLSAERYARDSVIANDPGPTRRGPPAGGGDREGGLAPATPMLTEAEAEAMHDGVLGEAARSRPWLTHTPIVPHEQPDGSWVYTGSLFTATISPEGEVSYNDTDAVSYDVGSGTGGFDLTDMVMGGAGADPYMAERERFMEETEDLRLRLEDAARTERSERDVRRVRGRLVTILGDEDRTLEARRRDIFRVWDEADDPIDGPAYRAAILAFIHAELPCGSPNGYTPSEVAALNALRESSELFDPC